VSTQAEPSAPPPVQHAAEADEKVGVLLPHLIGTFRLLKNWGCPKHLCLAGLFHSIYGTEVFKPTTVSLDDRELIRYAIGNDAEQVAYLYSTATRGSLYENLNHGEPYSVIDFRNDTPVAIARTVMMDLIVLDLANTLEQLPRITVSREKIESGRRMYQKAAGFLPEVALEQMHRDFDSYRCPIT
jgi:hypothetical protein